MIRLADIDLCTACGACAAQCPRSCITMTEGDDGIILPLLDTNTCIECHSCEKVCPVLNVPERHEPQQAYAAWSNDAEERRTSASGGVAIEIYKYAISKGWKVVGASQNEDFSVTHKVVSTIEELPPLKNSKYVFSDAYDAFDKIKSLLKEGERIVFIGLPCQVAALRNLFHDDEKLLLIEVVCHGTTPLSYLRQHIHYLELREGHIAKRMSFRDPNTDTYTYTFTLYDEKGEPFYAQQIKDGDTYQIGYHKAINYRENCYHCPFARTKRVSDICLSDYKGLGKYSHTSYSNKKVSCILVYSNKGQQIIDILIRNKQIHADEKPIQEPIEGDRQLREPSSKRYERLVFEKYMKNTYSDFEKAMKPIIKLMKVKEVFIYLKHLKHIPKRIINRLKNYLITL